jgi:hypothetical protein
VPRPCALSPTSSPRVRFPALPFASKAYLASPTLCPSRISCPSKASRHARDCASARSRMLWLTAVPCSQHRLPHGVKLRSRPHPHVRGDSPPLPPVCWPSARTCNAWCLSSIHVTCQGKLPPFPLPSPAPLPARLSPARLDCLLPGLPLGLYHTACLVPGKQGGRALVLPALPAISPCPYAVVPVQLCPYAVMSLCSYVPLLLRPCISHVVSIPNFSREIPGFPPNPKPILMSLHQPCMRVISSKPRVCLSKSTLHCLLCHAFSQAL